MNNVSYRGPVAVRSGVMPERARRSSRATAPPVSHAHKYRAGEGPGGSAPAGITAEKACLRALGSAAMTDEIQALVIVDVDHFRAFKNVHGAGATESLLRMLGKRLDTEAAALGGKMMRLGVDEFALLVPAGRCQPSVIDWANSLTGTHSFSHRGAALSFTASAGVTPFSGRGKTAAEALRFARQAVTQAKIGGGGSGAVAVCSVLEMQAASSRDELARDLPGAIARTEIIPFYQLVVSLKTRQVTGMEVLARWMHPKLGLLEPASFIPIAETRGLCSAVTHALLRQVRVDAQTWPAAWTFAFNTSPNELPAVLTLIEASEQHAGDIIHGRRIELEVTETALMRDLALARQVVSTMQPYGVKVVLDDFGSGYANFNQLCQVPFSRVKIDKSFVTDLLDDSRMQACVRAIIDLAHHLGMTATAEGVESPALADWLADMGCDHAQGFYFGRPMPAAEITAIAGRTRDGDGQAGFAT